MYKRVVYAADGMYVADGWKCAWFWVVVSESVE